MKTIVPGTIFLVAVIILMILGTSTSSFFTDVNAKTKQKTSKSGSSSSPTSSTSASDKTSSHTVKKGKTKPTKTPNTNTGGKGGTGTEGTGGTGGGTEGTGGTGGGTGNPPVIIKQPPSPPPPGCNPPNCVKDHRVVQCPIGYHIVGNSCVLIHPPPKPRPPVVIINCHPGFHQEGFRCVPNPCPQGTHLVGNHCVPNPCRQGTHLVGNHCVPNCPPCFVAPCLCPHPQPEPHPCRIGTHREGNVCVQNQVIRIIHKDVTNKHVTIERIINNVPVQQTVTNIPLKEFIDNLGTTNVILPTVNFVDANGILHIVGTVTNNGNSDVKIVNILATLEGNNKNILQIAHGLPVVNKLKANESTTFEIQVLQTLFKVSDIKKVTFHVDTQ